MAQTSTGIAAVQAAERANNAPQSDIVIDAKREQAIQVIKRDVAALIDSQENTGTRALILLRDVTAAVGTGAVAPYTGTMLATDKALRQWISDNLSAVLPTVDSENATATKHPRVAATQQVKQTVRSCFAIAAWLNKCKVKALQLVGDPVSRVRIPTHAFAGFDKAKRERFILDGDDQATLTFAGVERAAAVALASEGTRADAATTTLNKAAKIVRELWTPRKASDGTFAVSAVGAALVKAFTTLQAEMIAATERRKNAPKARKASVKAKVIKMPRAKKAA